jgi:hypothetical protein
MSYKHNDLRAMRERYWNDAQSEGVRLEKSALQQLLQVHGIYDQASLDDTKYVFFTLPSIVIVKGYAMGFQHPRVQDLIIQHLQRNKLQLQQRHEVKIQYKM